MGRGRKKWQKKRPRDEWGEESEERKRQKRTGDYRTNKGWSVRPDQNEGFNAFYRAQRIVPEDEWDAFMDTLQTPLPTTFRINSAGYFAPMLQERMKEEFIEKLQEVTVDDCKFVSRKDRNQLVAKLESAKEGSVADGAIDAPGESGDASTSSEASLSGEGAAPSAAAEEGESGAAAAMDTEEGQENDINDSDAAPKEKYDPPKLLPWYPFEYGWHFTASRALLRRDINLYAFHKFLISQSESGGLTRQEAVSMIPPLLLSVQPDHKVLDMCAAPGSKTSQLLEYLQVDWRRGGDVPSGFVVANDANDKRCYMLFHQVVKLGTPNCLVTNHEAQTFPTLRTADTREPVLFDRILADVPCSGDGTMRKNVDLWRRWRPTLGLGLHRLQVEIAVRAVQLLKVGGRLVYSTCSFNPMEDEAVVAQMLRYFKGNVELLDVSKELPELQRRPGLRTWKVFDANGNVVETPQDAKIVKHVCKSMFPPTAEEQEWMHLDRCLRLLPHLQNTGGFFVAVLQRTRNVDERSVPSPEVESNEDEVAGDEAADGAGDASNSASTSSSTDEAQASATAESPSAKKARKNRRHWAPDAPFIFCSEKPEWKPILDTLRDYYGIADDFPIETLYVRSNDHPAKIYMMSSELYKLFKGDEQEKKMRVVNTGVRLFARERSQAAAPYRLTSEGVRVMNKYMTKRVVNITEADFIKLLSKDYVDIDQFSADAGAEFSKIDPGTLVAKLNLERLDVGNVAVAVFRGQSGAVQMLIPKEQRASLSMLFLGDNSLYKAKEDNE